MTANSSGTARWQQFLDQTGALLDRGLAEAEFLPLGAEALSQLVRVDDWLPDSFAQPHPERYQQYLLHRDPNDRFSVVSFVWGPGQATPIHDHTVWGLVGMLRGGEASQRYARTPDDRLVKHGPPCVLRPGEVEQLSPRDGDVHQVSNVHHGVSISIHAYGADIGRVRRHAFGDDGSIKTFISGYSQGAAPAGWPGLLS